MLTQREIDIWRAEAEEYALKVRDEFLQALQGGRVQIPPAGPQQQPQPQQQAQPPMPPQQAGPAEMQQPPQPPMPENVPQ